MAYSVSEHFEGRSTVVRAIYNALLDSASVLGEFTEAPKKTSIHLDRRSAFAGIATRRDHLILTLKSSGPVTGPNVIRSEHASANRWYNEIRLDGPDAVNEELRLWLEHSYELSA